MTEDEETTLAEMEEDFRDVVICPACGSPDVRQVDRGKWTRHGLITYVDDVCVDCGEVLVRDEEGGE